LSFDSLLIHSIQLLAWAPGATDRYGNVEDSFSAPVVVMARVNPVRPENFPKAEEFLDDRDTRSSWFKVFLPPTASINALTRIIWEGRTLEVHGEPSGVYDGVGLHHYELFAKEING
jgi:hypothetical protein